MPYPARRNIAGILMVLMFALSAVAGFLGWYLYEPSSGWSDWLYGVFLLFTLNASFEPGRPLPLLLEIARFMSPLALTGTILSVVLGFLRRRASLMVIRLFYRRHAIVYARSPEAALILEDLPDKLRIALILADGGAFRAPPRQPGRPLPRWVYEEDNPALALRRARLDRAAYLFIFADSDEEAMELSRTARGLMDPVSECSIFTHFRQQASLLLARDMDQSVTRPSRTFSRSFSLPMIVARELVDAHSPDAYVPEIARGLRPAHVAVFGFGMTGQALAHEIIQLYRFADLGMPSLSLVGPHSSEGWEAFTALYPSAPGLAQVRIFDDEAWIGEFAARPPDLCFLAIEDLPSALSVLRVLRQTSIAASGSTQAPPRVVYIADPGFRRAQAPSAAELDLARGLGATVADMRELVNGRRIIERAEACDILARGINLCYFPPETRRGMDARAAWLALPDIQRDANRYPARHLAAKLRHLGWEIVPVQEGTASSLPLSRTQEEHMGRWEHGRWMAERLMAGYRPVDRALAAAHPELKARYRLHPDLVPWKFLSRADRDKDLIVLRNLDTILSGSGLGLRPLPEAQPKKPERRR